MFTLWGDGVLWAAGCVGLAAVAAGALQGISAGAVDVQLEAAGQSSGQLLTGLPVHLSVRHTHTQGNMWIIGIRLSNQNAPS